MHPARLPVEQLLADCSEQRTRRSGPGGQHRNKVETAVVLVHRPTGIQAEASERRSQAQNHAQALFRLRLRLALRVRQPPKLGMNTAPSVEFASDVWQRRRKNGKIVINSQHEDFPAVLAEALDTVDSQEYDVASAAKLLAITPSQMVKLLKIEPEALAIVNRQRKTLALAQLK